MGNIKIEKIKIEKIKIGSIPAKENRLRSAENLYFQHTSRNRSCER